MNMTLFRVIGFGIFKILFRVLYIDVHDSHGIDPGKRHELTRLRHHSHITTATKDFRFGRFNVRLVSIINMDLIQGLLHITKALPVPEQHPQLSIVNKETRIVEFLNGSFQRLFEIVRVLGTFHSFAPIRVNFHHQRRLLDGLHIIVKQNNHRADGARFLLSRYRELLDVFFGVFPGALSIGHANRGNVPRRLVILLNLFEYRYILSVRFQCEERRVGSIRKRTIFFFMIVFAEPFALIYAELVISIVATNDNGRNTPNVIGAL
mmetsp:Transcript_25697/g.37894  ORF Transcript_25697/g.37894 Transcript_25697/m.37894 type:complete len:264 (-) Transcript_25697:429-1220(-)